LREEQDNAPWTSHPILSYAIRLGLSQIVRTQGGGRASWIFRDMNWRSTSRLTDEALVFANIAGQGSQALLQVAPEDRMRLAVSMTKSWPNRIIFAHGPRFEEEGFRWALKSFLSPSTFSLIGDEIQPNHWPQKGPLGVSVTFPGYILEEWVLLVELREFVLFDRGANKWLKVQKPLEPLYKDMVLDFQSNEPQNISTQRLAGLIIARSPWITRHTYGALVSLDQSDARERRYGTLSCVHKGVFDLFVTDIDSSQEGLSLGTVASADQMFNQQKWIIR
jgi:hypothetical protein